MPTIESSIEVDVPVHTAYEQVKGDLERFKEMIESRDSETGEWRGEVEQGDTVR